MNSTRIALIAFTSGAVLGAVCLALFTTFDSDSPVVEAAPMVPAQGEARDLEEVRQLLARIDEQNTEIVGLRRSLVEMESEAEIEPVMTEEQARVILQEARRVEMAKRLEERFSKRADELGETLGLSEAQRKQLVDVYQRQFEAGQARRSGEELGAFSFDDALQEVLSEEQFDKYLETSQEEIFNRAEQIASSQVDRLSRTMQLSPEQTDSVFETVHLTAQEMMISRQTGEAFDMREVLNERLSEVLTEEQMSTYEEGGGLHGGRGGPRRETPGP